MGGGTTDPPSKEGISYPTISKEETEPIKYEEGKWGTHTMAEPSNPQSHPQNQDAASWEPLSHGNLGQEHSSSSGSGSASAPASASASASTPPPAPSPFPNNPYVATDPAPGLAGQAPADVISDYLKKWTEKWNEIAKKAEVMAGNVWQHAKTGPNMADTAWGRLVQGARLLSEGSYENIYQKTFEIQPEEKLRKTYACYLSTSSGPVAGTIFISTHKITFCSDRPLAYYPHPGQTAWSYYKVVLPLDNLKEVNPSCSEGKPDGKYIQIVTVDKHEFWFMGFVNYEKALKNLSKVLER